MIALTLGSQNSSQQMAKIVITDKSIAENTLRIDPINNQIGFRGLLLRYRDKNTKQIVAYIPSLSITGYGTTDKKAEEMLDFLLNEYLQWLGHLAPQEVESELTSLGWGHIKLEKKAYPHG